MVDKLMVVAHPDDEIVFGGAHLIQERNWMVVCVTNAGDKVRRNEFEKVMRKIGTEHEIWNYRDTYSYYFDRMGLKRDLERLIRREKFKKVVTHGFRGEYGHPQHKVISRILASIVHQELYFFSIGQKKVPNNILLEKKNLLRLYKSQRKTLSELVRDDALNLYIDKEHFIRMK